MANPSMNRAQRRRAAREARDQQPSFWTTQTGRIALIVVGVAILGGAVWALWPVPTTTPVASTPAAPPATPATSNPATTPTTPPPAEKVEIEDIKEGTGEPAKTGDLVAVHYTGTLKDGSKFDSSRDKGEPFIFTLGQGKVIQGWEQGIAGMKPGGRRKLTIPPSLGYGSTARPKIPANSTLLFDVELIKVIPGATK